MSRRIRKAYPEDLVTLRDVADLTGMSWESVRLWVKRDPSVPEPWRRGSKGEPHFYLKAEWERWWDKRGGRQRRAAV